MPEKERALVTNQETWTRTNVIDAAKAGLDVALEVNERFYSTASVLDNTAAIEVSSAINGIEIRFLLTTNNADVDIDIWAARAKDDNITRVCTLDIICGQQQSDDGSLYADTINISNINWPKTPKVVEPGTDHIARLLFDLVGYKRLLFHGYNVFNSDCIVEISGY